MIESVLNLGVKGADLVISQLEKIAQEKEKFARPANVAVNPTQNSALTSPSAQRPGQQSGDSKALKVLKNILDTSKKQKETLSQGLESRQKPVEPKKDQPQPAQPQTKKDDDEKKKTSDSMKELGKNAKGAVQGLATLSAGNALRGAVSLMNAIPFVGEGIAAAGNGIITAAESFRANVENAARINFDTAESRSRIGNLVQGSGGGNFTGRVDLDVNSQRALAETMGERFGVVQRPLQDAIRELYRSRDGRAVDVNQAQSLATGNFAALGTDKGFFLQKIADQLQGLPPSMRQAMQASLLQNVKKEEQFTETSTGARQAVTSFDNEQRERARDIATAPGAVQNALAITNTLNRIDATLNGGFNSMINALERSIRERSLSPIAGAASGIGRP
jgi:hypothetical protein